MSEQLTIVIAGASGMIGSELTRQLESAGHTVIRLVRHPTHHPKERQWDPEVGWLNVATIDAADVVINLSGASISKLPWTLAYKKQILSSRVQATNTITAAIAKSQNPPTTLLNASAVGFYGDRPGQVLTEQSAKGEGFLARVVETWERAALKASPRTRVVLARTGLVLGDGGALKPLELLSKLGVAGPLGSGQQIWPWISLHDEAAALVHLATRSSLAGPVNLAAPAPVTANELSKTLAEELKRPFWLPVPSWAIKTVLADAGKELLLSDQNVSSQLLVADGFEFRDRSVDEGIAAALGTS
ncbi:TIGR01777 family oxidoreductase [Agreia sp. COWG]|uniref:TIGR01777 family oxidoreductase n=1 Tax=Agreia sp. COWG TaxID=2773266 RepID=UPI00192906F9|nr:TIGR01777 family oxidoreductase [Agreia sp. COWG]CAD5999756.1 Cell division inhibitor [Agreia sp. COWG]